MLFIIQTILFAFCIFLNINFLNAGPHGVTKPAFQTPADRVTNYLITHGRHLDRALLGYEGDASLIMDPELSPKLNTFIEATRDHLARLQFMKKKLTVVSDPGLDQQVDEAIDMQKKRCDDVWNKIKAFRAAKITLMNEITELIPQAEVEKRNHLATEADKVLVKAHKPASCVHFDPNDYVDGVV